MSKIFSLLLRNVKITESNRKSSLSIMNGTLYH